jgi:hypothetical protein
MLGIVIFPVEGETAVREEREKFLAWPEGSRIKKMFGKKKGVDLETGGGSGVNRLPIYQQGTPDPPPVLPN